MNASHTRKIILEQQITRRLLLGNLLHVKRNDYKIHECSHTVQNAPSALIIFFCSLNFPAIRDKKNSTQNVKLKLVINIKYRMCKQCINYNRRFEWPELYKIIFLNLPEMIISRVTKSFQHWIYVSLWGVTKLSLLLKRVQLLFIKRYLRNWYFEDYKEMKYKLIQLIKLLHVSVDIVPLILVNQNAF